MTDFFYHCLLWAFILFLLVFGVRARMAQAGDFGHAIRMTCKAPNFAAGGPRCKEQQKLQTNFEAFKNYIFHDAASGAVTFTKGR